MFTKITLTAILSVAAVSASEGFLNLERFLQSTTATNTATCTADSTCAVGGCCINFQKTPASGGSTTTVLKTCASTQLHGYNVTYNGQVYSWSCGNTTAVTANAPT